MVDIFRKNKYYALLISLTLCSPILAAKQPLPINILGVIRKGRKGIQETMAKNPLYKDYKDDQGGTFLMFVAYWNDLESIKYLVEEVKIVNVNEQDNQGNTALMVALITDKQRRPDMQVVEYLIETAQADVTIGNKRGDTTLLRILRMIKMGQNRCEYEEEVLKIAQLLVAKESYLVTQGNHNNFTPLMSAIFRKCNKIATFFVEYGANIDQVDDFGNTAVSIAARNNNTAMLDFLVNKRGAKINPLDRTAQLPLMVAFKSFQEDTTTVKWLINHGAKANILINDENVVLKDLYNIHDQAQLFEVVQLLIEKGAANLRDLLVTLVRDNKLDVVNKLLDLEQVKQDLDFTVQPQVQLSFLKLLIGPFNLNAEKKVTILKKLVNRNKIKLEREEAEILLFQAARVGEFALLEPILGIWKIQLGEWPDHKLHQLFGYAVQYGEQKLNQELLEKYAIKQKFDLTKGGNLSVFLTSLFEEGDRFELEGNKINLLENLYNNPMINLKKVGKKIMLLATRNDDSEVFQWLEAKKIVAWNEWSNDELNACLSYLAKAGNYTLIHHLFSTYASLKGVFDASKADSQEKTFLDYFLEFPEPIHFFWGNDETKDPQEEKWDKANTLQFLADQGIVSIEGEQGDHIFLAACSGGARKVVEYILENRAIDIVATKNSKCATGTILASLYGQTEIINLLVGKMGELPTEEEGQDGMTCLMAAGKGQHLSAIETLLKYNANVNYQSKKTGKTVLMILASRKERGRENDSLGNYLAQKYPEMTDLILVQDLVKKYNANILLTDKEGKTACKLAEEAGNYLIAAYLKKLPGNDLQGTTSSVQANIEVENDHNNHDTSLSSDTSTSSSDDEQKMLRDDDLSSKNMISKNFELLLKIAVLVIAILAITLGIPYYLAKVSNKKDEMSDLLPSNTTDSSWEWLFKLVVTGLAIVGTFTGLIYWYCTKYKKEGGNKK